LFYKSMALALILIVPILAACGKEKSNTLKPLPTSTATPTTSPTQGSASTPAPNQTPTPTPAPSEGAGAVSGTGTVKYINNVEGGFYGIVADDGNNYDPINLGQEFKEDGLRIYFEAKIRNDIASIHMWGTLIEILAIKAAPTPALTTAPAPVPHHVGDYQLSYSVSPYGSYSATIFYPALLDGSRTAPDASEAPYLGVAVFSGQYATGPTIDWVAWYLASYGYVVLCATPPNPASNDETEWAGGFNGGISTLKGETNSDSSPIHGLVNTGKFGIMGLSSGGAGLIEATNDPQVGAAVALAPGDDETRVEEAAQNVKVPIQLQVGSEDGLVSPSAVLKYYNLMPSTTKEFVEIAGGDHIGFLNEWAADLAKTTNEDNPCVIGFSKQREIAGRYLMARFDRFLKDNVASDTYIFGAAAQQDKRAGVVSDLRYIYSGQSYPGL
jgi:dienelactone hydrolase